MKTLLTPLLILLLAGCASVVKVESGDTTVDSRLVVTLEGPWNRIVAPGLGPAQIWTMEGMPVDQLMIYSGLKDGLAIHEERTGAGSSAPKSFVFRSPMQPDEIVSLFEGMLTRDGSSFTLVKLEPATFVGIKGFHFEYTLTRKLDSARLSGLGYGAVSNGELFALVYQAPRLTFFPRHQAKVDQMARSARLKAI
jgi:hypothetical protein